MINNHSPCSAGWGEFTFSGVRPLYKCPVKTDVAVAAYKNAYS